jgi:hypothetical protein
MSCSRPIALGLLLIFPATDGTAQEPLALVVDGRPATGGETLVVVVDADDDDENNVADARQAEAVPVDDLVPLTVSGTRSTTIRVTGGLRLVRGGRPAGQAVLVDAGDLAATVHLQGTGASRRAGDGQLTVDDGSGGVELRVTIVALAMLGGQNAPLSADRDAVGISRQITNDWTLPRVADYFSTSHDPENVRIEIFDPSIDGNHATASIVSGEPLGATRAEVRDLLLTRQAPGQPFRSPWIRLVGDETDRTAPGVDGQVLLVRLRDAVRVEYRTASGIREQEMRVGRPGDENGIAAARRGRLRIRRLRHTPGGVPVLGGDDAGALALARQQVAITNEVWLQCHVDFGAPDEADVAIVDPPPPALLTVADGDGLPAAGGGVIRFRAAGRVIGPVGTEPGAPPVSTAFAVAAALREAGLMARVTENPPAEFGAGRSADIVVRTRAGTLVPLEPDGEAALSTDRRQKLTIGRVELSDGLQDFNNMTAAAGVVEERTLVKTLADDDPSTVDVFIVNHFTTRTRQGEAFIEADEGAIVNAYILDRSGVQQQRHAWTQSHELGHVLLNMPFHPDNVGPDRPWLLMDSDSSLGTVAGPKRLTREECQRLHAQSGVGAIPALIDRSDVRSPPPAPASGPPYDLGYPRPTRGRAGGAGPSVEGDFEGSTEAIDRE